MKKITRFVCGFLFNADHDKVVLIQKRRPPWQAGYWNGVGGHVEPHERAINAMRREFHEETGFSIGAWHHFCTLKCRATKCEVLFYWNAIPYPHVHVRTMTDETVQVFPLYDLPDVLPNLRWLIPLALHDSFDEVPYIIHDDRSYHSAE